jgi:hypothetical protein
LTTSIPSPAEESVVKKPLPKQLFEFVALLSRIARRFKGVASLLTLTGVMATLFLDYQLGRHFGLASVWFWLIAVPLLLPTLLWGWFWYLLDLAINLPERMNAWLKSAKAYSGELVQRVTSTDTETESTKLSDLGKLGGLAYEVASMGLDAKDVVEILGGSLVLANPLFITALVVSAGAIGLMDLVAVIWILF